MTQARRDEGRWDGETARASQSPSRLGHVGMPDSGIAFHAHPRRPVIEASQSLRGFAEEYVAPLPSPRGADVGLGGRPPPAVLSLRSHVLSAHLSASKPSPPDAPLIHPFSPSGHSRMKSNELAIRSDRIRPREAPLSPGSADPPRSEAFRLRTAYRVATTQGAVSPAWRKRRLGLVREAGPIWPRGDRWVRGRPCFDSSRVYRRLIGYLGLKPDGLCHGVAMEPTRRRLRGRRHPIDLHSRSAAAPRPTTRRSPTRRSTGGPSKKEDTGSRIGVRSRRRGARSFLAS